ncbi:MAG: SRPBCC domain-containing protein [Phycisphaerales bacterium]|nr:SRPBCC domain-containing protein [Phycisphaerales bacterium]
MINKTLRVTTPTDLQIVMTREFAAPRKLVWEAMTKPQWLRRWMFCPDDWSMTECAMDVRTGGDFRWVWDGPGGQRAMSITGVYREIVAPARIVHTELMEMGPGAGACGGGGGADACAEGGAEPWELLATLDLTETPGGTELRMTLDFPTKQARDMALASGMEYGVGIGYDRLDGFFAEANGG